MKAKALCIAATLLLVPTVSFANNPLSKFSKKVEDTGKSAVEKRLNAKLLEEARQNQCSFKSGTDVLEPGCDAKLKKLASVLIDAKRQLVNSGVKSYKFEVSGHTDSSGDARKNMELSKKRAEVIVKELIARGVPKSEIIAVGRGSQQPLVMPDDTPAKRAKNRRYELQVRL